MWTILVASGLGLVIGESIRRLTGRLRYRRAGGEPAVPSPERTDGEPPGSSLQRAAEEPAVPPPELATDTPAGDFGPDQDERTLPRPGPRWWITLAVGLAWAGVAWRAEGDWRTYLIWLPFAAIGAYLAAVDLDVRRLPDRAQLALAAAVLIAGLATHWTQPRALLIALAWAAGTALLFWVIHLVGRGALGFGDVKLAATCAWLLGLTGLAGVWVGLVLACLLAVGHALVRRTRSVAFGPWLILGTLAAGLWLGTGTPV